MNEYEPNPMLQNLVNKPEKNNNKIIFILVGVIVLLIIILLIALSIKPKEVTKEIEKRQSLDEVSLEISNFIYENKIDALDAYGYDNLARVAINKICTGVYNCNEISGEEVSEYLKYVFDAEVTFSDINCELNDGAIYTYDSVNNKFVSNASKHNHNGMVTKPIYTKVNSIKRKDGKILLVLNKLYYAPLVSDYITSEPSAVNRIYNSKDYMHTTNHGEDIDLTKLSANYENNFDKLKNTGTRYSYTFGKKDGHYVLEKYEVIDNES